ncbi:MAG: MBL fold metallo-hydrolase [Cyanobacteria bacterium]|nr:MBL fold metallo-hydrolase [Cyanobacteria bacterium CG_2015-16_32_12]NCO78598.1 MBL fold metallo-hydrolase [Cyanobacteria bacterium CG_2015-22_32_23]NCQ02990.1 MBL fold metallo-hydrolase [Cyanobacteria bacterium CG_2015-09_32_10]NCQ40395.1 MBL fold metallo-hydrolase [Cyanobacteria bacterium CG_2015-04_32_10]NCS83681.1 MBL fold metallo-hydrolase [Cyanobacteria bacterium CG_2015-02_32_10]
MLNRRNWIRLTGYGFLTTVLTAKYYPEKAIAQNSSQGVTIDWLGHSAFVFANSQARILVNPFTPLGCTAKYSPPKPQVDIVMISSRLLDEGSASGLPNNPQLMVESGVYNVKNIEFQGIKTLHDREKGRRFGDNIVWKWTQGGLKILHLGGIASPINIEQKILMGTPDIVFIPVGGGSKVYDAQEAMEAIKVLNPKMVIPTQYLTNATEANSCELQGVQKFVDLAKENDMNIKIIQGNRVTVKPQDLPPQGTLIRVFDGSNLIKN